MNGRTRPVDIITEVSELALPLAMPRKGHLEAVFRIYSYLKYKRNLLMVFDPNYPEIDHDNFPKRDWDNFFGDVKECIPLDMPEPLGEEVLLHLYVDADYAGDGSNRGGHAPHFSYS